MIRCGGRGVGLTRLDTGFVPCRVVHLWDAEDVSGGWLAASVAGYQGGDWDTYLRFGPDATWTSRPTALRSSGSPVDHQIDDLRQALAALVVAS
jgi:hypothetical protein